MNEGKTDTIRQVVSSVGNAWIVNNSKSHPGHVYYFNTLTGEAVWNLSDVEIEKARERTQFLERQHGAKPTKCPEPMGNPPTQQELLRRELNNKYRFGDQQPNISQQPGINIFQTQQSSNSVFSETPVNNMSAFDLNILNNQLNAFNIVATPAIYNSQAAYVPRTQQFFITPTMPVVNQAQASLNIAYNQLLENEQAPAMRYNSFQDRGRRWNRFNKRSSNFKRGVYRNFQNRPVNTDLRDRISLKRRLNSNSCQEQSWNGDASSANSSATSICSHDEDAIEDNNTTTQNTVEEHSYESQIYRNTNESAAVENSEKIINEPSTKINLTKLKCPEHFDVKQEEWYIVIDLNILLEEFTILCLILESDEHCKLVVPKNVMTELKEFIASSNNIPARRIYHSLSYLIESGNAHIAEIPGQDYGDTITNPILNTCFELLEENYHVILLSKNNELLKYKKFIKISMYTIDEIKSLLEIDQSPSISQHQSKILPNSIPQLCTKKDPHSNDTRSVKVGLRRKSATVTQEPINIQSTSEPQKSRQESSRIADVTTTSDAAIQTDQVTFICNNGNINKQVDTIPTDNKEQTHSIKTKQISNTSQTNLVPSVRRREIKLKRSISNQPPGTRPLANNIEKKPFRWRRRRTLNDKISSDSCDNKEPLNSEKVINTDSVLTNQCDNTQPNLECNANGQIIQNNNEQTRNISTGNVEKVRRDIKCPVNDIRDSYKSSLESLNFTRETSVNTNLDSSIRDLQIDQKHISNSKNNSDPTSNLEYMSESRESSVVCVNLRRENIIIEESSSSGIISNSESNIDSEFGKGKLSLDKGSFFDADMKEIVMYKVDNESMEESLKTKCEEWVSRFLQIMEEVLSVILHKESIFSNTALPPPWTLHEAAQCIRKYSNNAVVKCTTDKLSSLLFDLSDDTGKINMNMTPCQYMMMYSYGVSLLKAIKDNITNCEDIQIAENSLQTLLNDIKNPYCNSSGSDVDLQDISIILSNDETHLKNDEANEKLEDNLSAMSIPAQKNYNLRSSTTKTKTVRHVSPQSVTTKNNNEKLNKFSNINLKSITREIINNIAAKEDLCVANGFMEDTSHVTFSSDSNKNIASEKSLKEPNIVRKFIRCSKFEEKLMNVSVDNELLEHDVDYDSNNFISYKNTDLTMDSNEIPKLNCTDIPHNIISTSKTVHPPDHNNMLFKIMMKMFLQEVRTTLNDVKILCDSCYTELANPQLVLKERCELRKRAEYAQSHVDSLCTDLDSMWDRAKNTPGGHIQNALEKAGINMLQIDEHLLRDYGNTIDICKSQAEVFLHSIREIIAGFNSLR